MGNKMLTKREVKSDAHIKEDSPGVSVTYSPEMLKAIGTLFFASHEKKVTIKPNVTNNPDMSPLILDPP